MWCLISLALLVGGTDTAALPAGMVVFGERGYVEYVVGDMPLIIAVPHGGRLEPRDIPDRFSPTQGRHDVNTDELARAIVAAFLESCGRRPHVVFNRLHRKKLDTNRDLFDAAQEDPLATRAWEDYHGFIEQARERVAREQGAGLFIDLHGHRHAIQRLELGYLLVARQLALPDDSLGQPSVRDAASVARLAADRGVGMAELLRGLTSLGGMFERRGWAAVPAPGTPAPGRDPYFSGGYSVERHGSRDGGSVSGIQVETHWRGLRDTPESRRVFATAFAAALLEFLRVHYGYEPST